MKKRLLLDSLLGTIFIFFLIWIIYNVSAMGIFDAFDPIGQAIQDMEFTDVVFSQLRDEPKVDENVVLVNIGYLSRPEIAMEIDTLSKYNPKVIGIDSYFYPKKDSLGDIILTDAIRNAGNVVLVSKLIQLNDSTKLYDSLATSNSIFNDYAIGTGYANLVTDKEVDMQEQFKATRTFVPAQYVKGDKSRRELAFAVRLANIFSPEKTERFLKRNNETEIINYRGNIINPYQESQFGGKFFALDWEQVVMGDFDPSIIDGSVVIMGFLGSDFLDTSWDDKFFTPMNPKYAGRANPDMFGAVIHANIVSMIIHENYINKLPDWLEYTIGILLTFGNIVFFSLIYRGLPKWYDGATKVMQLVELLLLLFMIVMFFSWFSLKLNLTLAFAGIALAGDGLEVFYGVVMNIFSKEGRDQLFRGEHD